MDRLNWMLTTAGNMLLAPFRHYPATGLLCWSVVTGIAMTFVFGMTSNQRALRRAADNIRAQLFAVKLFKEDLVVTFHCQLKLLRSTGLRLLHSVPPMFVMLVPLLLVLTQLAMRYEFQPLLPGERTVVEMHIKPDAWDESREITLVSNDGFEVETQSLRDEKNHTILWRVRADGVASKQLAWTIDNRTIGKDLPMAASVSTLIVSNPVRPDNTFWSRVLYPAESCLPPDSPVESIDIQLKARNTPIFGVNLPWWATFFIVSMVVAFIAGKLVGVQY